MTSRTSGAALIIPSLVMGVKLRSRPIAVPASSAPTASMIASAPELQLDGTFTHFAVADEPDRPETTEQLARFNRVIHERPVTGELIYGLLALYLLLALAYAMAYQLINSLQPDAFRSLHGPLQINDFVYYSLVTLTTLGYGDIHALAPAARLLSVSEAVAGVMFIAIAVARSLMLINDRDDSA